MAGPRVWGDVPHIPGGGWTDPGTLRPPRRKAVGLLSFEATAEEPFTCDEVLPASRALQGAYRQPSKAGTPRRAAPAPPFLQKKGEISPGDKGHPHKGWRMPPCPLLI